MNTGFLKFFNGDKPKALKVILLLFVIQQSTESLKSDLKAFKDSYNIDSIVKSMVSWMLNQRTKCIPIISEMIKAIIKENKLAIDKTI